MKALRKLRLLLFTVSLTTLSVSHLARAQDGTWAAKAPTLTFRQEAGAGVVNGIVCIVGGSYTTAVSTVEAFDPVANSWTTKAPMPTPRSGAAVAVVDGILYAMGGADGTVSAAVEAYDPANDTWTSKAPMPAPRNLAAAAVIDGVIYVVGGGDSQSYQDTVFAYTPSTDTWTMKAPMPTGRLALGVGVIDGVLYAAGGFRDSGCSPLATLEAYDPATDTWTSRAPMSIPRWLDGAAVIKSNLYVVGTDYCTPSATVEAYNPHTDTWTTVTPMPTARRPAVAAANDVLYAIGGGDTVNVLNANEAFTPRSPRSGPSEFRIQLEELGVSPDPQYTPITITSDVPPVQGAWGITNVGGHACVTGYCAWGRCQAALDYQLNEAWPGAFYEGGASLSAIWKEMFTITGGSGTGYVALLVTGTGMNHGYNAAWLDWDANENGPRRWWGGPYVPNPGPYFTTNELVGFDFVYGVPFEVSLTAHVYGGHDTLLGGATQGDPAVDVQIQKILLPAGASLSCATPIPTNVVMNQTFTVNKAGTNMVLRWNGNSYTSISTSIDVADPTQWNNGNGEWVPTNTGPFQFEITAPATGASRFFRLSSPPGM